MSEENKIEEGAPVAAKAEKEPFDMSQVGAGAGKMPNRMPRFRQKMCRFCQNKEIALDYKNVELLERYITDRGKILPRRVTGNCAKHQRAVALEIKRARMVALLPFSMQ